MVRIEVEDSEEQVANRPKPSSSSSSQTITTDSAPNTHRNLDEGYETASDGELGDSDDDHHRQEPDDQNHQHQSQSDQQEEQIVSTKEDEDDELKQVSLSTHDDSIFLFLLPIFRFCDCPNCC